MQLRKTIAFISLLGLPIFFVPKPALALCSFSAHTVGSVNNPNSVYAADIDGDGDMDVVAASEFTDGVNWFENDGSGNFTKHNITTSINQPLGVFAIDLDKDGDMDVLSASAGDNTVAWYENDGSETFTKHDISTTVDAKRVYAKDVDGDGDIDVLSANYGTDSITWFDNNGSQSFTQKNVDTIIGNPQSVYAIDVDGDTDIDIVGTAYIGDAVFWYENDGSENFTRHNVDTAANGAFASYATDVDGDGDVDILATTYFGGTLLWYENDGSQNFTKHTIDAALSGPYDVYATDMDKDGDVDVLSIGGDVNIYENDGSQNFTTTTLSTTGSAPEGIYAADFNGDGNKDVVVTFAGDDTIAWYSQDCPAAPEPTTNEPGPDTSLDVSLKVDQADPEMNELSVTSGVPYTLSSKIPDADQVHEVYMRVNGQKYYFKHSDNDGYYILPVPDLPIGTYNFTVTADWGRTTKTIYGTITVSPKPKHSPFLPLINHLFRTTYNREITTTEWQYWADRLLNMNFTSIPSIFGAMQWQKMFGE